jgi:hypothetical protein
MTLLLCDEWVQTIVSFRTFVGDPEFRMAFVGSFRKVLFPVCMRYDYGAIKRVNVRMNVHRRTGSLNLISFHLMMRCISRTQNTQ